MQVGVCSRLFVVVVPLLLVLMTMGGMLGSGSGKWGLVTLGVLPIAAVVIGPVFTQLRNGTLAMHSEMMEFLERPPTLPDDKSDIESGLPSHRPYGILARGLSTSNLQAAAAEASQSKRRWPLSAPMRLGLIRGSAEPKWGKSGRLSTLPTKKAAASAVLVAATATTCTVQRAPSTKAAVVSATYDDANDNGGDAEADGAGDGGTDGV